MSIKIYDGRKVLAASLEEAISILRQAKPEIQKTMQKKLMSKYVLETITDLDMTILAGVFGAEYVKNSPEYSNPSYSVEKELRSRSFGMNKKKEDKPQDLEDCTIILYPERHEYNHETFFLFTLYGGNEYQKQLDEFLNDSVKEYGYWNNTDEPEEMSEDEWSARRAHWSLSLLDKDSAIPIEEGISIRMAAQETMMLDFSAEHLKTIMEDLNQRLKKNRPHLYIRNQLVARIAKYIEQEPDMDDDLSRVMEANRRYKNGQYVEELKIYQKIMIENMQMMLPKLNADLYKRKIEDITQEGIQIGKACVQKSNLDTLLKDLPSVKRPKI